MKKVLMIMRFFIGKDKDNLYTKHISQIKAFEKMGCDVWYTAIEDNMLYLCNGLAKLEIGFVNPLCINVKMLNQIFFYHKMYLMIYKHIKFNSLKFDIAYIRSMFASVSSFTLLNYLARSKVKIIMEIPTYPVVSEIRRMKNIFLKFFLLFNFLFSKLHAQYVTLYAVIGEDCRGMYFGKNAVNIDNGIEIENVPLRKATKNSEEIHVLALATMSQWHGYDRFIKGMYEYYKNGGLEKIKLHMVGNDGDGSLALWKRCVVDLHLSDKVVFEGFLKGDALENIFNKCDIALAALGGHRKGIYKTKEMKLREYMARGIPFIFSSIDDMLIEVKSFCLRVENSDDFVKMSDIVEFVDTVRRKEMIEEEMRDYADKNMSWVSQFNKLFEEIGG